MPILSTLKSIIGINPSNPQKVPITPEPPEAPEMPPEGTPEPQKEDTQLSPSETRPAPSNAYTELPPEQRKFTREEALKQFQFEEKKLRDIQEKNIKKAQKILEHAIDAISKLGFTIDIHKPEPSIAMRGLNVLEWQKIEKQNFRNSFLPKP